MFLTVPTDGRTVEKIGAITRIMQCFENAGDTQDLEILIRAAFIEYQLSDQERVINCNLDHLAWCVECQEAQAYFRGKLWTALLDEDKELPQSVSGLECLTLGARRYFFPAYLLKSMREKDVHLLSIALHAVGGETWTPLQEELIEFVKSLLQYPESW